MLKTRLTLSPGENGTKKLQARYGERLLCVRYRYDIERRKRMKTVEWIGGASLITVEWTTTRGPLVLLAYAALVLASGFYLRLELVQDWRRRFVLTLGSFMLATLMLYLFIGLVLACSPFAISAWGHSWRLGVMLLIGCALSAAVAQLTATKPTQQV